MIWVQNFIEFNGNVNLKITLSRVVNILHSELIVYTIIISGC